MKRSVKYILLLGVSFSVFAKVPNPACEGVLGADFTQGDGSLVNPYLICNKEQFNRLSTEPALLPQAFQLGADLNFAGDTYAIIGSESMPFQGAFDGDGYSLASISLPVRYDNSGIGLFGKIQNATIKNLTVQGIDMPVVSYPYVGGMIGKGDGSTLTNLHVRGLNLLAPDYSGGLVGKLTNSSLTNSSVKGTLIQTFGTDAGGGLIGFADNVDIFACFTNVKLYNKSADPFGVSNIGGLVGSLVNSRLRHVYARGGIDYSNAIPGSFMKPQQVGGLVGVMGSNSHMEFAYYAGKITIDADNLGGVVGVGSNALSATSIPASPNIFWDTQLSGVIQSAVGDGVDTVTMKQAAFWTSHLFDPSIWILVDGRYPRLVGNH